MKDDSRTRPREMISVPRYWLIAEYENNGVRTFTVDCDGEEALPIFSSKEEAETFLGLEAPGAGWWIRETTAGELVSLLYGLCAGVRKVALDPPAIGDTATFGLLCLSRRRFLCDLANRRKVLVSR